MLCAQVANTALELHAEHAVYLPEQRSLLVADVHLGKAVAYRRLGVPVPRGTTAANLAELSSLLERTQAQQLVFLGDLFHSGAALQSGVLDELLAWRHAWLMRRPALQMRLVEGNHDTAALRSNALPAALALQHVAEPFLLGNFALCHLPQRSATHYVLAGHIHPSIALRGRRDSARLACFWFGAHCGVLPAFGQFTGSYSVQPERGDQVFVVADEQVLALPQR
jgi:uncharacterized protein